MKNLPDKIFLNLGDLTEEEYNETDFQELSEVTWSEDDVQGRNVEYVRKDDFIKNAEKYLTGKFINDVSVLAGGVVSINFDAAISSFVKYMKG